MPRVGSAMPKRPQARLATASTRSAKPFVPALFARPTVATMLLAGRRLGVVVVFVLVPIAMAAGFLYHDYGLGVVGFDVEGTIWEAGRSILAGESPYPQPIREHVDIGNPAVYPAAPLVATAPLSLLPLAAATTIWIALLVAATVLSLRILNVKDWRCYALAFAAFPVLHGISFANVTMLLVLGVAVAWRYRDRPWIVGVAVAALIATKLFLWPLLIWLVATRRYRAAAAAAGGAALATVAAWAAIGFKGFLEYPRLLSTLTEIYAPASNSIFSVGLGLGLSSGMAHLLAVAAGGALVAYGAVAVFRLRRERAAFALFLAGAIVLSPIVWPHYYALLLVPIALFQRRLGVVWSILPAFWLVAYLPRPTFEGVGPADVPEAIWGPLHAGPAVWHSAGYAVLLAALVLVALRTREDGSYSPIWRPRWAWVRRFAPVGKHSPALESR